MRTWRQIPSLKSSQSGTKLLLGGFDLVVSGPASKRLVRRPLDSKSGTRPGGKTDGAGRATAGGGGCGRNTGGLRWPGGGLKDCAGGTTCWVAGGTGCLAACCGGAWNGGTEGNRMGSVAGLENWVGGDFGKGLGTVAGVAVGRAATGGCCFWTTRLLLLSSTGRKASSEAGGVAIEPIGRSCVDGLNGRCAWGFRWAGGGMRPPVSLFFPVRMLLSVTLLKGLSPITYWTGVPGWKIPNYLASGLRTRYTDSM